MPPLRDDGQRLVERLRGGDLEDWREAHASLEAGDRPARAWALACRSLIGQLAPGEARAPTTEEVDALSGDPNAAWPLAIASATMCRLQAVALDLPSVQGWSERAAALARHPEARAWSLVCRAWGDVLTGHGEAAAAHASDARERAQELGLGYLAVEAAAVGAMALSLTAPAEDFLKAARRVSMMARAEALPQQEILAHAVLARSRRLAGRPYLAVRILGALRELAPLPWHGWLDLESTLAGAPISTPTDAPVRPVDDLQARLVALEQANEPALARAAIDALRAPCAEPYATELRELAAMVDPRAELRSCSPRVQSFCGGDSAEVPLGLGAIGLAWEQEGEPMAFVLACPGRAGRRLLRPANAAIDKEVLRLPVRRGKKARSERILAALALAGAQGLDEGALFAAAFGFRYVPELHGSAFGVSLHRARALVEGRAELVRGAGHVSLRVGEPFVIPDPRCAPPNAARMLQLLAEHRVLTPQEASDHLAVSLRSAHRIMGELVEDGACRREQRGRRIEYVLDDTVFSDPTGVKLLRDRERAGP